MEKKKENVKQKIRFYVMSLWLVFFIVFILTVNVRETYHSVGAMLKENWLPMISAVMCLGGFMMSKRTDEGWEKTNNPAQTVVYSKREYHGEDVVLMAVIIVALICMDFSRLRHIAIFLFMLVAAGYMYVRTDLYYGSPALMLLGYRIYRADIKELNAPYGIVLVTKDRIDENDRVEWIAIDDHVWIVRKRKLNSK